MTEYRVPIIAVVGANMRDAKEFYRELVGMNPEVVFGKEVRTISAESPDSLRGMRVDEYIFSTQARVHRNYNYLHEELYYCSLNTIPPILNGAK